MSRQWHSPWFNNSNNNSWRVQVTKLLITHSSAAPSYCPVLRSKIVLSILFSNTFNLYSSLSVTKKFHSQVKLWFCIY
jgi:hypothetical protein